MYLDQWREQQPRLQGTDPNRGNGPLETPLTAEQIEQWEAATPAERPRIGDQTNVYLRGSYLPPTGDPYAWTASGILLKLQLDLGAANVAQMIEDTRSVMSPEDNTNPDGTRVGPVRHFYFTKLTSDDGQAYIVEVGQVFGLVTQPTMDVIGGKLTLKGNVLTWTVNGAVAGTIIFDADGQRSMANTLRLIADHNTTAALDNSKR